MLRLTEKKFCGNDDATYCIASATKTQREREREANYEWMHKKKGKKNE